MRKIIIRIAEPKDVDNIRKYLYSFTQACEYLDISRMTLVRLVRKKVISPFGKFGSCVLFHKNSLDCYLVLKNYEQEIRGIVVRHKFGKLIKGGIINACG